jgi:hypothetical protein
MLESARQIAQHGQHIISKLAKTLIHESAQHRELQI